MPAPYIWSILSSLNRLVLRDIRTQGIGDEIQYSFSEPLNNQEWDNKPHNFKKFSGSQIVLYTSG